MIQCEPMSFNKASWNNFGVYIPCGCEISTIEIMTHKSGKQAQNISRCSVIVDIGKAEG